MRNRRFCPRRRAARFGLAVVLACLAGPAWALDPGDSNRDLRVSAPDFTALVRILAGDTPGNDGADANRDGFILPDDVEATAHRLFGVPIAGPTATSTPTANATATATATSSVTATASSTSASTSTATATRTPTPSLSPTLGATATRTATATPSPSFTPTPTRTRSPSPTSTGTVPTATRTPTPTLTSSFTPSPTRTRTSTRTVTSTRTLSPTVTPTVTSTPLPLEVTRCSNTLILPLAIPDGVPAGTSNTFIVADNVPITDLNVDVKIDHDFVGDLQVELTHVNTGTTVTLIDQAALDCALEDIECTFDDEAARLVSSVCSIHDPAIGGGVVPAGILGEFNGENLAGTWRLRVADLATQDLGQLVSWCLRANSTVPVITRFVCNDEPECTVALGEPFSVTFDFTDSDANATSFVVTALNQAGQTFDIGDLNFEPTGADTYTLNLNQGFQCPNPPCNTTLFEFRVTVTDADAQTSPFASVNITSLGTQ
jgi:subtilisin-like proprotein convertase family protein